MAKDEGKGDKVAVAVKAVKSIEELAGVGPATAEKLREAGFTDLMGLAVASPTMVADAAEIGTNVAQKIIIAAREAVDIGGFGTGDVVLERRESGATLTRASQGPSRHFVGALPSRVHRSGCARGASTAPEQAHPRADAVRGHPQRGDLCDQSGPCEARCVLRGSHPAGRGPHRRPQRDVPRVSAQVERREADCSIDRLSEPPRGRGGL